MLVFSIALLRFEVKVKVKVEVKTGLHGTAWLLVSQRKRLRVCEAYVISTALRGCCVERRRWMKERHSCCVGCVEIHCLIRVVYLYPLTCTGRMLWCFARGSVGPVYSGAMATDVLGCKRHEGMWKDVFWEI